MRMIHKKLTRRILQGALILLASCTELDTSPRQSLTPDIALSDIAGYESLAFSMYNRATSFNYYG